MYIGLENGIGVGRRRLRRADLPAGLDGLRFGRKPLSSPRPQSRTAWSTLVAIRTRCWRGAAGLRTVDLQIWKGLTNDQIVTSSPAVVNGHIYIGSADDSFPQNKQGRLCRTTFRPW